jgi:sec-independent protein translocase protein TatC
MSELKALLGILDELRSRALRIGAVLLPLFAFFITFQVRWARVRPFPFVLPYPFPNFLQSVAAQVVIWLQATELPPGVTLLNLGVGDVIIAEMEVALFLTLVVGMPWIVHEIGAFLIPALRSNERELLKRIAVPATLLFIAGFLVGLLWITPFTYRILFLYVGGVGLPSTLGVESFMEFTLLYTLAFGLVCELPVFVYALTRMGLVPGTAWRKHWRGAVLGCLIFGMVITPDNSGITMMLIALPMMGLYVGGMLFSERYERQKSLPAHAKLMGGSA